MTSFSLPAKQPLHYDIGKGVVGQLFKNMHNNIIAYTASASSHTWTSFIANSTYGQAATVTSS